IVGRGPLRLAGEASAASPSPSEVPFFSVGLRELRMLRLGFCWCNAALGGFALGRTLCFRVILEYTLAANELVGRIVPKPIDELASAIDTLALRVWRRRPRRSGLVTV